MKQAIFTHQNADFDAVASMLAAHKLYPEAQPVLPHRQNREVQEFLSLYRGGLPFLRWQDVNKRTLRQLERVILTDTQDMPSMRGLRDNVPTLIIEHHPLERPLHPHETWRGETIGAVTTLLVEDIRKKRITLNTLEATLLALGIYADTGMMTYSATTPRDIRAAAWLLDQGAVLDTVRRFIANPLDEDQQNLFELLMKHTETRIIHGYDIVVGMVEIDQTVQGINAVTTRLRDMFDAAAICTIVNMPRNIQLVCRSTDDAIDVGELARMMGGGGHPRASAAAIDHDEQRMGQIIAEIWDYFEQNVQPAVRVADLMSYGVQTVRADDTITNVITRIRRIGHEGYPVIDDAGALVGLLTIRDADRALEHGLKRATVREVMRGGEIFLRPEDSVASLEQTIVNSGWGQIPIIQQRDLIGIVTRTDLIKHWVEKHPSVEVATPPMLSQSDANAVLGEAATRLIEIIAREAQERNLTLYMVGGVVRDLLLQRQNDDIDFVVEGSGIAFAEALATTYGGKIHSHKPFGTAKWLLDDAAAQQMGLNAAHIPATIDFATARNEFYAHPTALPTVYSGSIKLDLGRRDFTINTLAVQLSPLGMMWRVLDFYGGLQDLDARLIRVLHSLSFVDDPTRILRAVRFSERLQFVIEPRTAELIHSALPMLGRITGERLRNELDLLLQESDPARGIMKLQALGVLTSIHPAFSADERVRDYLQRARLEPALHWHLIMAHLPTDAIEAISERLLVGKSMSKALCETAALVQDERLQAPDTPVSVLVALLEGKSDVSLNAAQIIHAAKFVTQRIKRYRDEWQHLRPKIDGNDLKARGLPPGREYSYILGALRDAWLDERVRNADEEQELLDELIRKAYGHDGE